MFCLYKTDIAIWKYVQSNIEGIFWKVEKIISSQILASLCICHILHRYKCTIYIVKIILNVVESIM